MAALSGRSAKIRFTSVTGTNSTNNAATRSTGVGGDVGYVQINATARQHWDRDSTSFALYRQIGATSTSLVSTTEYTINYVQGKFEARTGDLSTGTYTIDAPFLTNTYLTGGQSWTADVDNEMLETTSFATSTGTTQWRTFIPGLSGASVSIERLNSTGDTGPVFYDRLNLKNDLIVELVTEDFDRFEGYGWVESGGWQTSIDGLTAEAVDITIDGRLYYTT